MSKIRVMLVDDSAVVRGLLDRALSADPTIEIVASAGNGEVALSMLSKTPADVIVLDMEMPVMDGLTALPKLLQLSPRTRVIMSSTLTLRNAEVSIQAIQRGATDYIAKPSSREPGEVQEFYRQLIEKIKSLAPHGAVSAPKPIAAAPVALKAEVKSLSNLATSAPAPIQPLTTPVVQSELPSAAKALAIASSTGGPQALLNIFRDFKGIHFRVPIFITQHMPANFTTVLAEHISKACGHDCHEAIDGEEVQNGKIYLAPGDFHMTVKQVDGTRHLALDQNPPENFCRPSADPMLRSLSSIYRDTLLVVVLTGLGADGARGARESVVAGAKVIAQDEATSVVYGMPKAVADAKLTSAVFPLNRISSYVLKAVT